MCWNIYYDKSSLLFQLITMNIYEKQLKSENIEILYVVSASKESVQINCKKNMLFYGTSMNINILLTYLLKVFLAHFMVLLSGIKLSNSESQTMSPFWYVPFDMFLIKNSTSSIFSQTINDPYVPKRIIISLIEIN